MAIDAQQILAVLDHCDDNFTFPMLDNGYVYLAATRLSLYRAAEEWAMVIEVFGFSPRSWLPDTAIYTFASTVCNRDIPQLYGPKEVSNLLAFNPNNDFRPVYPIEEGDWQDPDENIVAAGTKELVVRRCSRSSLQPGSATVLVGLCANRKCSLVISTRQPRRVRRSKQPCHRRAVNSNKSKTEERRAALRAAPTPVAGKLSLRQNPVSTDVRLNVVVRDGRIQKHLLFCCSHLSCQRLEQVEKVGARINLRLIGWYIAVVAHHALVPRSLILPGKLEP